MNLTQFEWVNSELKRIFYEQYKTSGKLVISLKRILNLSTEFTSSKSENVFSKVRFGLRVGTLKTRGALLQKSRPKGYPSSGAVGSRVNGQD